MAHRYIKECQCLLILHNMVHNQIRELIPIEVHNGQQAVNARHLYEWLRVRKNFIPWMQNQISRCDLIENVDYEVLDLKVQNPQGGRPSTDYALSINAAKEISMMSQTEKGKEARRYFIECEKIAKQKNDLSPALPKDFEEALTQLLAQVRMNKQLEIENQELHQDVQTQHNINCMLQGEIDTLQPKGRVYDQVISTPNDLGLKTTSSVANEIGMSGQKLNKMLIACGIIYKQGDGDYLFTSDYRDWDLGKTISCIVNEEKGLVKTYIKWNTRGRAYIHALNDTNWDKRRAWHLLRDGKEVAAV